MNKEAFDKIRVPGAIHWDDACVIRSAIIKYTPETVLEMGVFQGLSTLVIIEALEQVNHERNHIGNYPEIDFKFVSVDKIEMGGKFSFNSERSRSELVPDDAPVEHVVADALKYLQRLPDESIDLIFEDTTHQTEFTKKLIPEILRVLKPNGVALFHDLMLETMERAFIELKLMDKLKLFQPSWMGMLRKENGVLV